MEQQPAIPQIPVGIIRQRRHHRQHGKAKQPSNQQNVARPKLASSIPETEPATNPKQKGGRNGQEQVCRKRRAQIPKKWKRSKQKNDDPANQKKEPRRRGGW
ncbi:MAG: hypothetical protein JNM70_24590 [Anaerolineae bacterium]|nr:hypothetical protein [Anaerolineae bacterium]